MSRASWMQMIMVLNTMQADALRIHIYGARAGDWPTGRGGSSATGQIAVAHAASPVQLAGQVIQVHSWRLSSAPISFSAPQ